MGTRSWLAMQPAHKTVPELCRNRRQLLTTRDNRPETLVQQRQHPRGLLLSGVYPVTRA